MSDPEFAAQPFYALEPIAPPDSVDRPGSGVPARPARAVVTKSAARKIIEKYIEISSAPDRQVRVLASALGTKDDAADIAATVVSATRNPLTALTELETITSSPTPFGAMVAALALGRDGSRRVWALLGELGRASGNLPAKDATSAAKIAEAAASLTDTDRSDLDTARAFGRK